LNLEILEVFFGPFDLYPDQDEARLSRKVPHRAAS
jgi:hypothetical protein